MAKHPTLEETFAEMLEGAIGADRMRLVRAANTEPEKHPHVCASHDFCDANMVMDAAFADFHGREYDMESDEDARLWSEAWDRFTRGGALTRRESSEKAQRA